MLGIFDRQQRPAAEFEVDAFVATFVGLGMCVEDPLTGELRSDWTRVLEFCTGWQWCDIQSSLVPLGMVERMNDGAGARERLTEAGVALSRMARIAFDRAAHDEGGLTWK